MIESICFIVNHNMYDVKRHFTKKLCEALERKGVKCSIFDTSEREMSVDDIEKIADDEPDLLATFNTVLPLQSGKFYWDYIEIPHLSLLVDPAIYSVLLMSSPSSIIGCVDRSDCALVESSGCPNGFFLPHGVESDLPLGQDKKYDVVMLGSCYDHEGLRASWQNRFPKEVNEALDLAADNILKDHKTSIMEAVWSALASYEIPMNDVDFAALCFYADYYARGKDRLNLLQSITEAEVHVFGQLHVETEFGSPGWDNWLKDRPNIKVHPAVSFQEGLEIQQQAKVALNSSPFFKTGTHERMFSAMAAGAVLVTNDTTYVREQFSPGENMIAYKPWDTSDVNEQITALINDDAMRQGMVEKARALVLEKHTWDNRAEMLINEVTPMLARMNG